MLNGNIVLRIKPVIFMMGLTSAAKAMGYTGVFQDFDQAPEQGVPDDIYEHVRGQLSVKEISDLKHHRVTNFITSSLNVRVQFIN